MKKIIFILALISTQAYAELQIKDSTGPHDPMQVADVYVDGYYRRDGTYVRPHVRSNPDGNCWNNYSGCK